MMYGSWMSATVIQPPQYPWHYEVSVSRHTHLFTMSSARMLLVRHYRLLIIGMMHSSAIVRKFLVITESRIVDVYVIFFRRICYHRKFR